MREYIAEKQNKIKRRVDSYILHGVPIKIIDEINFDLDKVIKKVEDILPNNIFSNLKVIKIRNMKEFGEDLPFNAYYANNRLFLDNEQDSVRDAVDDIIHEISHHIENKYGKQIYGDGRLKDEFLSKRTMLYDILSARGLTPPPSLRMTSDYNKQIDKYLYSDIGKKLYNFLSGLFLNEYSITSLREYYGVGFEKYLLDYNSHAKMKKDNPVLYEKITNLVKEINEKDKK